MKRALIALARSLGFSDVYVTRAQRLERWGEYVRAHPERLRAKLNDDPNAAMPECASVILLVWPYQPYELEPAVAAPSAYYVASNASYKAVGRITSWLREYGHKATEDTRLPEKALAEMMGAGRYGRNGLIAAPVYGSRIALQSILTDAELDPDEPQGEHGFSDECKNCRACGAGCPVGALGGDSVVDLSRCLRALDSDVPAKWRHLLGGSLIGCDLCQDCCPRNHRVSRAPVPQKLLSDMSLEALLAGDSSGAASWIGANFARKKRMQARACIVAANLGRADLLPMIRALLEDDSELVRDAAGWAAKRLEP